MKDDTKYLLLGAAAIAGGYWWYTNRQKKTVTPTQTYLVGTFGQPQGTTVDTLSVAMLRFCSNPTGLTNVEKILVIEEVIRPIYLEESVAYKNDAGRVAYSDALFTTVGNRVSVAYCGGTTPERVQQASAWAREVWIAEENPGAGFS